MKMKAIALMCVTLSLASCATNRNSEVVRKSVNQGYIEGIGSDERMETELGIAIGFKGVHAGDLGEKPYSKIDELSAKVLDGEHKDRQVTFFLGKSKQTGEWEVFAAMVEADGKWIQLPVRTPE